MKHVKVFEVNMYDVKKDKYLYLFCWNDGYTVQDEGWIQRHYEEILDDPNRLDIIHIFTKLPGKKPSFPPIALNKKSIISDI